MSNAPQIAEVAALVGDPARANMLVALLGGRALTATELAYAAGVSPQTTSGHLGKLSAARLIVLMKQGRHRYYRLAGFAGRGETDGKHDQGNAGWTSDSNPTIGREAAVDGIRDRP